MTEEDLQDRQAALERRLLPHVQSYFDTAALTAPRHKAGLSPALYRALVEPFAEFGKSALFRGPTKFFEHQARRAERLAELGLPEGGLFKDLAALSRPMAEGHPEDPTIATKLFSRAGEFLTGDLPDYLLAMAGLGPVGGLAALGAEAGSEQGKEAALVEALKGGMFGGALGAVNRLNLPQRLAGTSAAFLGQALAGGERDPERLLEEAATGGVFGLMTGPGGGESLPTVMREGYQRPLPTPPVRPPPLLLPPGPDFRVTPGGQIVPRGTSPEPVTLQERIKGIPPPAARPEPDLMGLADSKGLTLYQRPDGVYEVTGAGGLTQTAASKEILANMLLSTPGRPPDPVATRPPGPILPSTPLEARPKSTFEKVLLQEPLTGQDKLTLQAQQAVAEVRNPLDEAIRLGELGELPPIGGGAASRAAYAEGPSSPLPWAAKTRLILPTTQPALAGSPIIRQAGRDFSEAFVAQQFELKGLRTVVDEQMLAKIGPRGSVLDHQAMQVKEGTLSPDEVSADVREAVAASKTIYDDFAPRLNTPQDDFYATHKTDRGAMYATFRESVVQAKSFQELEETAQTPGDMWLLMKIGSQKHLETLQATLQRYPNWEMMPKVEQTAMREMMEYRGGPFTKWEQAPMFMQKRLPKDIFMPYLLPRTGGVPYEKSLIGAVEAYIPYAVKKIRFDPVLTKWEPVVSQLPGPAIMGTEKGYLSQMLEGEARGKVPWDTVILKTLFDRVNQFFHHDVLTISGAHVASTVARSQALRGLLSLDSTFWNTVGGNLNTWMESGNFTKAMGRFIQEQPKLKELEAKGLFGDIVRIGEEWNPSVKASSRFSQAVKAADEWLNRVVLLPFHQAEFLNRGVALMAGVEEAMAKGVSDHNRVLVNGIAKQSTIVPNLQLSDAEMSALFETVPKTQFGSTISAQRSPYFRGPLGRLSTLLTTYYTQQGVQLYRGVVDSFNKGDSAKLRRFLIGAGVFAALPTLMGEVFGIDIRRQFGIQGVLGQISIPYYQFLSNGIRGLLGQDPLSKKKAIEQWENLLKNFTIPQYRYLEKTGIAQKLGISDKPGNIIENIERGYVVDKERRYLYETTPLGELGRLIGLNPEEGKDTYELQREIMDQALEHSIDRREAINGLLNTGDPAAAQDYYEKWGSKGATAIRPKDLMEAQKNRMRRPEERALRQLPKRMRRPILEEAQEPWYQGVVGE